MRKVFADTVYWVATVRPDDPYHRASKAARDAIGPVSSSRQMRSSASL